jgi:uncharacterized membrane protein
MWGNYGHPGAPTPMMMPPPAAPVRRSSGLRIAAVVLLVLAAALTLGGSFAPALVYSSQYGTISTIRWTAWTARADHADDNPYSQPLDGFLLSAGVLLAVVAVVMLLTTGRRPDGRVLGRSIGVGAGGLLVGAITQMLLENLSTLTGQLRYSAAHPDSEVLWDMYFGPGAYLLLAAALCGLVAAALLLISARADSPRPARYPVHP